MEIFRRNRSLAEWIVLKHNTQQPCSPSRDARNLSAARQLIEQFGEDGVDTLLNCTPLDPMHRVSIKNIIFRAKNRYR